MVEAAKRAEFPESEASTGVNERVTVPVPPLTLRSVNLATPADALTFVVPARTIDPLEVVREAIDATTE